MLSRRWSKSSRRSPRAGLKRQLLFEALDARELLATLTVGPSSQFSTIQGAVNNAASGDVIVLEATPLEGGFAESVNLSLMGSAVGGGPGNLTIRGFAEASGATTIIPTAGSAFFNSSAFNGNLTLEHLTLRPNVVTAGRDAGLNLVNFTGALKLSEVQVIDAADIGVEVVNSSGTFVFEQVDVRRNELGVTPIGIRLANFAGSGYLRGVSISDMLQTSILVEASSTTQTTIGIIESTVGGTGGSEAAGDDGIRILGSDSSVIHATIAGNNFDELPGHSLEIASSGSATLNARLFQNTIVNSEGLVRTAGKAAVKLVGSNTSQLNLDLEGNTVGGVLADSITLQGLNTAKINASIVDNLLTNVGSAADHEGILIFGDSLASATINALVSNNPIVSPFGSGIRVIGQGTSTYNVSIHDNFIFYSSPSDPLVPVFGTGVAAISAEGPTGHASNLNLRITNNEIGLPTDPNVTKPLSIRINRQTSGQTFRVEATGSSLGTYLAANNFLDGSQPSISNVSSSNIVPLGTFLPSLPLTIGSLVWADANKDGIRNDNELGVFGSTMTLVGTETVSGQAVARTVIVDGDGAYGFGALLPGTYTVTLTPPSGLDLTGFNRGEDEAVDSDFRQGIRAATVTLAAGTDRRNLDAGLIPTDGFVWKNQITVEDVNDDGLITPLDALLVIIDLNANGPRLLPAPSVAFTPQPFLDVNGDGVVNALDALLVILRLNTGGGGGNGEGEPLAPATSSSGSTTSDDPLLPPEFFAGNSANSQASSFSTEEDETSALDAFFADY